MKFKGKVSWWFYAIMIGVAASLDRIEIKCRSTAGTMISVDDKEGVLNEMKNRGIA